MTHEQIQSSPLPKNPKLLIHLSFAFGDGWVSRDFYIFKPRGYENYHVKFAAPRHLRESLGVRQIWRSSGTPETEPARRILAMEIEKLWKGESSPNGSDGEVATIGELLDVYMKRAKERPVTVKSNANSLLLLVRSVHGDRPERRSTSVLNADLIRRFEARATASAFSIASYVRQAKSVVALRKMKFYEELNLPDLKSFREECVESPEVVDLEPLDMNAMRAMEAAAPKLAVDDPAVYVAHLMFAYLGMRDIEIWNARESWIVDGRIGIIKRPSENFFPKGTSGWIPIAADVLAELDRFKHLRSDGYLVPGATKTDRHKAIYRRHSTWVKTWIRDRRKTSYELRRYSGSRLLDLGATLFQVRDFLRHRDVQTTQRWYAYRLQNRELPTIGMRDLVPAEGAA